MRSLRAILTLTILAIACGGSSLSGPDNFEAPREADFSVLFVGNSLTYWNTLPAIVEALADSAQAPKLKWGMVAFPDYNLEDHWARGDARSAIAVAKWDYVVLQQGPSSVLANREQLITSTRQFNGEIARISARAALFSVWPQISRQQDFPAAIESYRLAAEAVTGLFFPVASAWLIAASRDPSIALYSPDGLHPSAAGSYLAALVMFQQLFGRSPVGLPARVKLNIDGAPTVQVTSAQAAVLQAAAKQAVDAARTR